MNEMKEKAREVTELLKVLANENRILILCELIKEPMSVNQLRSKLTISQSGISQHLALLKHHGILDFDKHGQTVVYKIQDKRIYDLMDLLRNTYCK